MSEAYPRLSAGDLTDKIIVQWPTKFPDGAGGSSTTWGGDKTLFAEVVPMSGGEAFRIGVENRTQFYRIRVRYRADVDASCRVLLAGVPLNIRSAADPRRDREQLLIMAESGVADG